MSDLPKGVYRQRKQLSNGSEITYYRLRRNGIRILGEPGTDEFAQSLEKARTAQPKLAGAKRRHAYADHIHHRAVCDVIEAGASRARGRAKARGHEYSLTPEYVRTLIKAQKSVCAVSGLAFDLSRGKTTGVGPFRPSIDRIDSSLGYVPGNVRVVCFAVNIALNQWGEDVFLMIASSCIQNWFSKRFAEVAKPEGMIFNNIKPLEDV